VQRRAPGFDHPILPMLTLQGAVDQHMAPDIDTDSIALQDPAIQAGSCQLHRRPRMPTGIGRPGKRPPQASGGPCPVPHVAHAGADKQSVGKAARFRIRWEIHCK
jgi:hypothetical protein